MNTNSGSELKSLLRREKLNARLQLTEAERYEKSLEICSRILEIPEFKKAGLVMAYKDFRGEAGTEGIIRECFRLGKRVALPAVADIGGRREIQAYEACPGEGYVLNCYGICEPDPEISSRVEEAEIDLVIVPGVAFDLGKYRVGYGAGYYDRFLPKTGTGCLSVGIAYELQIVDTIPVEMHDVPLDMIVTERRVII